MSSLLPITFTSIILAWISQQMSKRYPSKKERVFFLIMAAYMVCFVGLRLHYNDTDTYRHSYEQWVITNPIDWRIGNNPGYQLVARTLRVVGVSSQTYFMIYAVFTVGTELWFIRKYSSNLWLSIFLYVTFGGFIFSLAAMKQCAAIAFGLLAVDRYLDKKLPLYILFVLLGMLFHPYTLMFLVVPLMDHRPWSWKTWVVLASFLLAGFFLNQLIGTVVSITTMLGEEYNAQSFEGAGINPFRVAVVSVPVVVSFVTRRIIWNQGSRTYNVLTNLSMLSFTIMFVGLFGTANYFGRLANYFILFQVITLPWLLSHFDRKSQRVVTALAVICYLLYFIYAYSINQRFDNDYYAITLIDYLKSLI